MYAGRAQYSVFREAPADIRRFSTAMVPFASADQKSSTFQA